MSHRHDQGHHHHDDHHHHEHQNEHHHCDQSAHAEHGAEGSVRALSDADKLRKIVEHWIHHNDDHAGSYRDWAHKAQHMGLEDVAALLEDVAGQTGVQNGKLQEILKILSRVDSSGGV